MKVAIVGVTGVVGETILRVLDERNVAVRELGAFASRDRTEALRWRERDWPIRAATPAALAEGGFAAVFLRSGTPSSRFFSPT